MKLELEIRTWSLICKYEIIEILRLPRFLLVWCGLVRWLLLAVIGPFLDIVQKAVLLPQQELEQRLLVWELLGRVLLLAQLCRIQRNRPVWLIVDKVECQIGLLVSIDRYVVIICSVYCRCLLIDLLDQIRDKFCGRKSLLTLLPIEVLRKGLEYLWHGLRSLSHWLRPLNYERIWKILHRLKSLLRILHSVVT